MYHTPYSYSNLYQNYVHAPMHYYGRRSNNWTVPAVASRPLSNHYPRIQPNPIENVKTSFSKEEAAAIALLLGIDFTKSTFDQNEFWMGVNTELEHGRRSSQTNVTDDNPLLTGKIALAHLNEIPDYYKRLKALEEEAKAYWKK